MALSLVPLDCTGLLAPAFAKVDRTPDAWERSAARLKALVSAGNMSGSVGWEGMRPMTFRGDKSVQGAQPAAPAHLQQTASRLRAKPSRPARRAKCGSRRLRKNANEGYRMFCKIGLFSRTARRMPAVHRMERERSWESGEQRALPAQNSVRIRCRQVLRKAHAPGRERQ